jgi:hypothetical protein
MKPYLDPLNKAFADDVALAPPPEQLGYVAARAQIEGLQKSDAAYDIAMDDHEIPWKSPDCQCFEREACWEGSHPA